MFHIQLNLPFINSKSLPKGSRNFIAIILLRDGCELVTQQNINDGLFSEIKPEKWQLAFESACQEMCLA